MGRCGMSEMFPEDDDRCVDVIDQACKVEQRMRQAYISAALAKSAPEQEQVKDEDGNLYWPVTECVDCDDDIPPARLALGKIRCVICQSAKEARGKQYGR